MNKVNKYYALAVNQEETEADLSIYGDITSWRWLESDVSSYLLSRQLESLPASVRKINVYINSYGGEVAEGLAIYNALKRHKAKVVTYCDGFACSIASVIFMAGEERIMSNASALMIHNAWMNVSGNPEQLRKQADDLEKISNLSKQAYLEHVNICDEELQKLLDDESYLTPTEALEKGFATSVTNYNGNQKVANQSVKKAIIEMLIKAQAKDKDELKDDQDDDEDVEEETTDNNKEDEDKEKEKSEKTFEKFLKIIGGN